MAFELWTSLRVPSILLPPWSYLVHTSAAQGRQPLSCPFCFIFCSDSGSLSASAMAHLSGCEGGCSIPSEVWLFELGRDQLCIKCHHSSAAQPPAAAVTTSFSGSIIVFCKYIQSPPKYLHLAGFSPLFSCSTFFSISKYFYKNT